MLPAFLPVWTGSVVTTVGEELRAQRPPRAAAIARVAGTTMQGVVAWADPDGRCAVQIGSARCAHTSLPS